MKLIYKIAGHVLRSGYCRRCGASHKEQQWEQIPDKCALIDAATLSLCKCHACGNEAHDFYKVEDTEVDRVDFTCGTRYEK